MTLRTLRSRLDENRGLRRAAPGAALLAGLVLSAWFVWLSASPRYYLGSALEPHAGEAEALPLIVHQGVEMVRAHRPPSVRLSPSLGERALTLQRYTESLYPIRVDTRAPIMLLDRDETLVVGCRVIDQRPLVRLAQCD